MVDDRTMDGGVPLVYMTLATVQRAVTGGRPLITAVATTGTPADVPAGLVVFTPTGVVTDTVTALGSAVSSIDNTRSLMWVIAAAIVASMLYVAALERKRDFAVLKALGVLVAVAVPQSRPGGGGGHPAGRDPGRGPVDLHETGLFAQPVDITPDARLVCCPSSR